MSLCLVSFLVYSIRLSNLLAAMVAKIAVTVHGFTATRTHFGNCLAAFFAILGIVVVTCATIRANVTVVTHGIGQCRARWA